MKGRTVFTILLIVMLLSGILAPYAAAQEPIAPEEVEEVLNDPSLEQLNQLYDQGLIGQEEFEEVMATLEVAAPARAPTGIQYVPPGWLVIDNLGTGGEWNSNDTFGVINRTNSPTPTSMAAEASGSGIDWDTELWSPSILLGGPVSATVEFESNFQDYAGNGDAWVDISTDGGTSWTNLWYWSTDHGPTFETINLDAYVGNTIILRWRYACTSATTWYWHIDDVHVFDDGGTLLFESFEPPPHPVLDGSYKMGTAKIEEGAPIDYTIVISNSGDLDALTTEMIDVFPWGTTYVPASLSCSSGTCSEDGIAVYWNGTVLTGTVVTVEFSVDTLGAACGQVITNTAYISDPMIFEQVEAEAYSEIVGPMFYFWDFELDDGGFVTSTNYVTNTWEWGDLVPSTNSPPAAHSGTRLWATNLAGDIPFEPSDHYLTKTVDVPYDPYGAYLQWWDWWHEDSSDEGYVYVNGVEVYYINANQLYWDNHTVSLLPWMGQTVDIVFYYYSGTTIGDGGAGWYLDDVAIHAGCTLAQADLVMSKYAPSKADAGQAMVYNVVVENLSPVVSVGTMLTDTLPLGVTYTPGSAYANYGNLTDDAGHVYWNGAVDMMAGPLVITIPSVLDAPCGEVVTNTAVLTDSSLDDLLLVEAATEAVAVVYQLYDFEADDGGFVGTNDWEWGVPTYPPGLGAHSGANVWATVLDGPHNNLDDWSILTKTLDLPASTPLMLEWWHYLKANGSGFDYAQVLIDGNVLFDSSVQGDTPGDSYVSEVHDISAYAGQTVDLVFQFWATSVVNDDGWYIDDVTIYEGCPQPDIVVDAPPLEAALCPDETAALDFSICNVGNAPLEWTLIETTTMLTYLDETVVVNVPAVEARPGIASRVQAVERPARQFEMHIGWVSLQPIDLLIVTPDVVGGGDISLLLNTLAAFPDLNVVVWDGNAGTPTVGDMLGYDVVFVGNDILWTSSTIDKTVLSDTLADYLDVGGKVLAGSFVWSFDDWGLGGGRFITDDYSPYEMSTLDYWDPIALGTYDAGHPIMAGITDVTEGYNHQDPALSSTGTWVASWEDDENFAAVSLSTVGLNQLHFHQAAFGGQTGELLHNALLYLETSAGPDAVPWLSEEPVSGTLGIAECVTVTVTFNSQWMDPGEYYANLIIESNDPDEPEITLPVTMTVLDCTGGLAGYVMDFETGDVDPTCTEAEVYVEPGDLIVPVGPDGYYGTVLSEGTYTLTASAPGYAAETAIVDVTIGMTTTQDFSLQRPVVGVTPTDFISVTATISEETTYPLVISNTGHQPLDFEIIEVPAGGMSILGGGATGYLTTWLEGDVEIDPLVFTELDARGATAFFVQMRLQADLSPAYDIQDWNIRGQYVYNSLRSAAEAQNPVIDYAQGHGLAYETRLSNNSVFIKGGTIDDVNALAARADVKQIRANHIHELEEAQAAAPEAYGWNLDALDPDAGFYGMEAAQVWDWFQVFGEGVVVANIDTGVFYEHEALVRQYRGNNGDGTYDHDFNWYAPTITATVQCGGDAAIEPCDEDNHGSGTAGIMVGETEDLVEQNGAAPGAQWVACMGCDGYGPGGPGGCSEAALTGCADWMVAPCPIGVDPGDPACDPDMRPHIINNSWGDTGCDETHWYEPYIAAWRAAGQFPAFSAGNTAACGAVGSPGDTPEAFGTAAHAADGVNLYAGGPSCWFSEPSCSPFAHEVDPHLNAPSFGRAPGNVPGQYYNLSGTSGASPHTAGCVALMWSANPSLIGDIDTTYTILEQSADRTSTQPWAEGDCGKPACAGADTYPNYEYGWGYLDCYAAVEGALTGMLDIPWVWTDPSSGTVEAGEEATIDVTFLCTETQDYSATLRIFHNDPCENSVDVPIVLHCEGIECDPVSGADFIYSPAEPVVDVTVTFTGSVAAGDAPITYAWNFGDGTTGVGMTVTHVFTPAAEYTVVMTATNCDGAGESIATHVLTVTAEVELEYFIYLPIIVKDN